MINAGKPMTNEEAVKILKNLMAMKNIPFLLFSQRLAVGMAIDALKEESQRVIKPENEAVGFEEDEIFLLSKEEYEKYKDKIPAINCWWWLRSHGSDYSSAAYVYRDDSVSSRGCFVGDSSGAVRPALKLKGEYDVGARIVLNAFPWVVIDKSLAIAEVPIAFTAFNDNDNNSYRDSDVRAYLKRWLEDRSETSEEPRADVVKVKHGTWFPGDGKYKWNISSAYPTYSTILEGGKPKKGTWMMSGGVTMCSNCYYKLETTGLLSRCPNCGAEMEV